MCKGVLSEHSVEDELPSVRMHRQILDLLNWNTLRGPACEIQSQRDDQREGEERKNHRLAFGAGRKFSILQISDEDGDASPATNAI